MGSAGPTPQAERSQARPRTGRLGPASRPIPSPRTREQRSSARFGGEDRTVHPQGREKRAVGVRPGVLQTDGAGAETPGTAGSRASRGPEGSWGALGLEVGRRGCPCHISGPRLLPATNTTKTAPLLLADAMAAGMAPWNHSVAALRPRRSLGVLSPRSGVGPALSVA